MADLYNFDFILNDDNELEIFSDSNTETEYTLNNGMLKISAKINQDGDLEVTDITPYDQWQIDFDFDSETSIDPEHPFYKKVDHQVIERVILNKDVDNPEVIGWYNELATSYDALRHSTTYNVPGNGLYYFQKIILPTKEHALSNSNEVLYYDNEDNKVHYVDLDYTDIQIYDPESDFDEIYSLLSNEHFTNCFYFGASTFSMYELVKCYVLREYERLKNYLKNNCKDECSKIKTINTDLDILLSAILVLDFLIKEENYFEAQRILNGLTSCGSLCKDLTNNLDNCGCAKR